MKKITKEDIQKVNTTKSIFTFTIGRNIYTVDLSEISKLTLLENIILEHVDDVNKIRKKDYILTVYGKTDTLIEESLERNILLKLSAKEKDYKELYTVYTDLTIRWDEYNLLRLNN